MIMKKSQTNEYQEWCNAMPEFTDKELLEIFPESRIIIEEKINEFEKDKKELVNNLRDKLTQIKYHSSDDFSKWFWREWVKTNDGEDLINIENNIARLKRYLITPSKFSKEWIGEAQISQALAIPIEDIFDQSLRKVGRSLTGLCPFHKEKHASFNIYPDTNSFYCYGCKQGGNVINFVKLFYGYSFFEAVKYLINK